VHLYEYDGTASAKNKHRKRSPSPSPCPYLYEPDGACQRDLLVDKMFNVRLFIFDVWHLMNCCREYVKVSWRRVGTMNENQVHGGGGGQ
jgi:hypothetical protein